LCTMAEFVQKKSKTVLLLNVLGQIHERGEMLHNITGLIPDGAGLRDVVDQILLPFGLNDRRGARFSVEGDDVHLHPNTALTLAMVFHELATNAAKYGALSNGGAGKIDITWQVEPTPDGERMRLRWQESGGPPVRRPSQKGFGSGLIEGARAQELDGEVHLNYEPAGVGCQIVMPVSHRVVG
jgi:two-component sensor histidine kinase